MPIPKGLRHFPPGVSGNPGGRPREEADVIAMIRSNLPEMTQKLIDMVLGVEKVPPSVRVNAYIALSDRGIGKPRQSIEIRKEERRFVALLPEVIRDPAEWERYAQANAAQRSGSPVMIEVSKTKADDPA
jgi:hypothetical protein